MDERSKYLYLMLSNQNKQLTNKRPFTHENPPNMLFGCILGGSHNRVSHGLAGTKLQQRLELGKLATVSSRFQLGPGLKMLHMTYNIL